MRAKQADSAAACALARLRRHRYGALVETLVDEPSFLTKSMFGGLACYLHGRMQLALMDRRPPWRGLLIVIDRAQHASLRSEMPSLAAHPVLGKWLLLAETAPDFEAAAGAVVSRVHADDPRIGVEPKARRRPRHARTRRARPDAAKAATTSRRRPASRKTKRT